MTDRAVMAGLFRKRPARQPPSASWVRCRNSRARSTAWSTAVRGGGSAAGAEHRRQNPLLSSRTAVTRTPREFRDMGVSQAHPLRWVGVAGLPLLLRDWLSAVSLGVELALGLGRGHLGQVVGRGMDIVPAPVLEVDERLAVPVNRYHPADDAGEALQLQALRIHQD